VRYLNEKRVIYFEVIYMFDMIALKIMVGFSTILVGAFYTRHEIKALIECMHDGDYVSWFELNKAVARRESNLY
jgi:hypothetical protein